MYGLFKKFYKYFRLLNKTTNEDGKWGDVHRWHKKEKQRWDEAVAAGLVKPGEAEEPPTSEKKEPIIGDGDVGCTGASSTPAEEKEETLPEEEYLDPGPLPKNLFDKGFKENWMEVLFPISLRKDALKHGGYSRPPPGARRKKAQGKPMSRKPIRQEQKNKAM